MTDQILREAEVPGDSISIDVPTAIQILLTITTTKGRNPRPTASPQSHELRRVNEYLLR